METLPADPDARARRLEELCLPFVRATVVRAERPTSARPGDSALLDADGALFGFVGGNCVQGSVRKYGLQALSAGNPLLLRVLPGEPGAAAGEGAVEVRNPCLSGGAVEIFLQPVLPPPHVLVVGDTPVAHALSALGACLDLRITLRPPGEAEPVAADAALVVASHGTGEEAALEAALRAGVPYVALVASHKRAAEVLASLDVDPDQRGRVHSPAGLALGARTPAETALSILAEFTALRSEQAADAVSAEDSGTAPTPAGGSSDNAGQAVDPVCGMTVEIGAATPRADAGGVTSYFCCPGCRAAFQRDPDRYAAVS
ncbi:XdhC family protein [Arthrobacter sp. NPDC055585]